jgi:hypothetical protein
MKIQQWAAVAACAGSLCAMGVVAPLPAGAALHPIPGTYTIHENVEAQGWTSFTASLSANHSASIVGIPAVVGTWKLTTLSTGAEKITITFHYPKPVVSTNVYHAKVTTAGFASLGHPGNLTFTGGIVGIWYATLG